MLAWRDELLLAGWMGNLPPDASPRLQALAAIETTLTRIDGKGKAVKSGVGDRLQTVLTALETDTELSIQSIDVVNKMDHLPFLLRQLFIKLRACQVQVHNHCEKITPSSGNLGAIKAAIFDHKVPQNVVRGDDSLQLLETDDEWSAANADVMDIPGMDSHTALAFVLAGKYLEPLLPTSTIRHLAPHFAAAKNVLDRIQTKQGVPSWMDKVRVINRGPTL